MALVAIMLAATSCGSGAESATTTQQASSMSTTTSVAPEPSPGETSTSSTSAQPDELTPLDPVVTVKVGVVGAFSDMGLFLAVDRGYFRDVGLEIEVTDFPNSGQMIAPLASDQIDVAGGAVGPGLWNSVARGLDIRAVADKGSDPPGFGYSALMLPADSQMSDCSDMAGARVGISAPSNSVLHSLAIWLATCDLELTDIETTVMGFSDMTVALENGSMDVVQSIEPLIAIAEDKGIGKRWIGEDELRAGQVTQQAILLFGPGFRANRDVANRFMVAYARGVADYRAVYTETGEIVGGALPDDFLETVFRYTSLQTRELAESIVPAGLNEFAALRVDSMQSDFDWFKSRGEIEDDQITYEDAIDSSFVEFARTYLDR
ncbi:MAG: ABC transporter substrate-binding protein [Acidimicrobiia bacterium]